MASVKIIRKDSNGHIISKSEKNYHISFKENVDIIEVPSYKRFNQIGEEYEESAESIENEVEGNFIDTYEKTDIEECPSKDPKAFSKNGCFIF